MKRFFFPAILLSLIGLTSCAPPPPNRIQGYIEGEFVYVASPQAGALRKLLVKRGDAVKAGDPLFSLDTSPEQENLAQAQRRLSEAHANLADARKGKREPEIRSLEAQITQARAALEYSSAEWDRQKKLSQIEGAGAAQDLEKAREAHDQDAARLTQMEADLETARLGAREDLVSAAEANVRALEATAARSQWELDQKSQACPQAGIIFDTLSRPGEWVEPGRPGIALLPPENIKLRAFVPERLVGSLHQGDPLSIAVEGVAGTISGKISFISPQAEYTPPVIYSNESREKMAFMIEAIFDPKAAAQLHPGQPVDVQLRL